MTTTPLLSLRGLCKRYGGLTVTSEVDLDIVAGETHAIIGPNGAGKTTLISLIAGETRSDGGSIVFDGHDITHMSVAHRAQRGIGHSYQITSVVPEYTVQENVVLSVLASHGHAFHFWRPATKTAALTRQADEAISLFGLEPVCQRLAAELSYGQQRLLEIAMALAGRPKLLLLDEPMAGMGPGESEGLVRILLDLKKSYGILLIEHDMEAVFSLADRISVLFYGKLICTGDPESIRNNPTVREAYLGEEEVPHADIVA